MQAARDRAVAWIVGVEVAVLGFLVRRWARNDAAPLEWNDSADYLAAAAEPLASLGRLAGSRPVLLPLVLSGVGRDLERLVLVQTTFAAVSWGLLAAAVAATLAGTWRPVAAGAAVLVLSLTWPLSMWDQQVLTESLALSSLALVCAAGVAFAGRPGAPWPTAALVAACWVWLLARDSHVVPVALLGLGLGVVAWRAVGPKRVVLALGAAYLLALCLLTVGSARHGGRDQVPLEHVYAVRILPYPDRVAWMAAHGMPDEGRVAALPEHVDPAGEQPLLTLIGQEPELERWRTWLAEDGRDALVRYALTHPTYVVGEGLREPERVFNNAGGLEGYKPLAQRDVPLPAGVANPPTIGVVLVGLLAAAIAVRRRVARHPLVIVGGALALLAAPHALVVWHADGMEAARHLLLASAQLRIGVLLLVVAAALAGPDAGPAPARAPDATEAARSVG